MEQLTTAEKEAIGDILGKLRKVAENDKTVVQNIKIHNFDILILSIALNSKYTERLIQLEHTNKKRYRAINNEFRRLINKIF